MGFHLVATVPRNPISEKTELWVDYAPTFISKLADLGSQKKIKLGDTDGTPERASKQEKTLQTNFTAFERPGTKH